MTKRNKIFTKLLSITLKGAMMLIIGATGLTTIQTASADDGTIYLLENEDDTYTQSVNLDLELTLKFEN